MKSHNLRIPWNPIHITECRIGGNKLSIFASFIILRSGEGLTNKNNRTNFSSKEKTEMMHSGMSVVLENAKISKPNLVVAVVLILEVNGLYYVY